MRSSLEFLLGLLDEDEPASIAQDDFDGPHGRALHIWQEMGFLSRKPSSNPVLSCPHCGEGVPYHIGVRLICDRCRSRVDPRHLLLWPLERETFLCWLAEGLHLRGGVRRIDEVLWQLGTWTSDDVCSECFYVQSGVLSDAGQRRLAAYRNAVVLYSLTTPPAVETSRLPSASLLEILQLDPSFTVSPLDHVLRRNGNVRFDPKSGALRVGDVWLGEVPVGSKEYHFLQCLADRLDAFVAYADLKHEVLQRSGSTDGTEEATFCQRLKNRIKKKWVPKIDVLLATTNKGDGYRLRAQTQTVGGL